MTWPLLDFVIASKYKVFPENTVHFKSPFGLHDSLQIWCRLDYESKPSAALDGHGLRSISGFSQLPTTVPGGRRTNRFHTVASLLLALKSQFLFFGETVFSNVALLNVVNYPNQSRAEIRRCAAWFHLNPEVRFQRSTIIQSLLCPHFLSHSWLTKTPMTLCCYTAVLF